MVGGENMTEAEKKAVKSLTKKEMELLFALLRAIK